MYKTITTILIFGFLLSACQFQAPVNSNQNTNTDTGFTQANKEDFSHLFNDPEIKDFTLGDVVDGFASGEASVKESSGFGWMAKKIDGEWTIIYKGQENVRCSLLAQYDVPVSFHPYTCYGDDDKEIWYSEYLK